LWAGSLGLLTCDDSLKLCSDATSRIIGGISPTPVALLLGRTPNTVELVARNAHTHPVIVAGTVTIPGYSRDVQLRAVVCANAAIGDIIDINANATISVAAWSLITVTESNFETLDCDMFQHSCTRSRYWRYFALKRPHAKTEGVVYHKIKPKTGIFPEYPAHRIQNDCVECAWCGAKHSMITFMETCGADSDGEWLANCP